MWLANAEAITSGHDFWLITIPTVFLGLVTLLDAIADKHIIDKLIQRHHDADDTEEEHEEGDNNHHHIS